MHRAQALLIVRGDQQRFNQVRGNQTLELAFEVMAAQPGPWQQERRHDQQQPQGAQEVKGTEVDIHISVLVARRVGAEVKND
ncbi:hypothetical protein D3C76_1187220 [compost metagenome]